MQRFALTPLGPYSLAASTRFLEGFAPAAYHQSEVDHFHLAFMPDGGGSVVAACFHDEDGTVAVELVGDADLPVVRAQVARILSLDIDGREFPAVADRDAVADRLQHRYPGLRPVLFYSPYEAAAWALISHRIRMTQAARVKARMAEELGPEATIHGDTLHAFPVPERLAELETYPGLSTLKLERLRSVAYAAESGLLDARGLRESPPDVALSRLKELPGVGDFSAELILIRGAGVPDYLPASEPRLARAVARAYDLDHLPSPAEVEALAAPWRPYRSWMVVLLRTMLEDETQEIASGGRRRPTTAHHP